LPCVMESRKRTNCEHCKGSVESGELIWPVELGSSKGFRWSHYACADAAGLTARKPLCKHHIRGKCLYGDDCFFRHADESQETDRSLVPTPARTRTCGGRRNIVRNTSRASAFRRLLLDEIGLDIMKSGCGVLDVAGGGGDLAFELLNINDVPSTCVDPRPPRLDKCMRKWGMGLYWWNPIWRHWNGERPPSPRWVESAVGASCAQAPRHLRLLFEDSLTSWATSLTACEAGDDARISEVTPEALAWLRGELASASRLCWTRQGLHEGDSECASTCASVFGDECHCESGDSEREDAEPALAPKYQKRPPSFYPNYLGDVAFGTDRALSAGAGASQCESCADGQQHRTKTSEEDMKSNSATDCAMASDNAEDVCGEQEEKEEQEEEEEQEKGDEDVTVERALEIARLVRECSAVVGLHPDQAVGHIVDYAIASRKPFAVVPCCVYSAAFPKRKLRDGTPVRSYEQLIEYLKSRRPGIRTKTLDFGGKNVAVYWSPYWAEAESSSAAL